MAVECSIYDHTQCLSGLLEGRYSNWFPYLANRGHATSSVVHKSINAARGGKYLLAVEVCNLAVALAGVCERLQSSLPILNEVNE